MLAKNNLGNSVFHIESHGEQEKFLELSLTVDWNTIHMSNRKLIALERRTSEADDTPAQIQIRSYLAMKE